MKQGSPGEALPAPLSSADAALAADPLPSYLRANGFKNFIVSGGSIEFLRQWGDHVYCVPPELVIQQHRDAVRDARR